MKILLLFVSLLLTSAAFAGGAVNLMELRVYKVAVSTDPLCSNPKTIFETENPNYSDFLDGPDIGDGQISDGTYPCVIIEFSNVLKYSPKDSIGSECNAAVTYSQNICPGGTAGKLADGTSFTCVQGVERKVAMYLSTSSTDTSSPDNPFTPPTGASDGLHGINLASALVVDGTSIATFVVNASNNVIVNNGVCDMQPPLFSFVKK